MVYHGMSYQSSSVPILESNEDVLLPGHSALVTSHNYQQSNDLITNSSSMETPSHNYFGKWVYISLLPYINCL